MNLQEQLLMAIVQGNVPLITLLLTKGAPIGLANGKETALHLAVRSGQSAVVELLLNNGADIQAPNHFPGNQPIHEAVYAGKQPIVELLLRRGANIHSRNTYENTPLHLAAYKGEVEIAKLLLRRGAKINSYNAKGRTPLSEAAFWNQKILQGQPFWKQDQQQKLTIAALLKNGAYSYYNDYAAQNLKMYWQEVLYDMENNRLFYTTLLLSGVSVPSDQVLPPTLAAVQHAIVQTIKAWLQPLEPAEETCAAVAPSILRILPKLLNWINNVSQRKEEQQQVILNHLHTSSLPADVLLLVRDAILQKALVAMLKKCDFISHRIANYLAAEIMANPKLGVTFHTQLFKHNWPEPCQPPMTKFMRLYRQSSDA